MLTQQCCSKQLNFIVIKAIKISWFALGDLGTNEYCFGNLGTKLPVRGPYPKFGESWHLC